MENQPLQFDELEILIREIIAENLDEMLKIQPQDYEQN